MNTNTQNKIYVVGHKNPDTDSICSAISYAYLKEKITGEIVEPMRAGTLNEETQYVLDTFKITEPNLLPHVYTQVSDLEINTREGILETTTIGEAWSVMKEQEARTLSIVKDQVLQGMISVSDVANACMNAAMNQEDSISFTEVINKITVSEIMSKENIVAFHLTDCVKDITEVMAKKRHRDFPILDENGMYVGTISRRNLLDSRKKHVILVDHNEKVQAVDGLNEAELLEIIDHHKLGLETSLPVFVRNQPVGCTSTIVNQMFEEAGIEVPAHIAALMCSAILSDTLMFRSPTCTVKDKETAEKLASIAGIEIESYADAMFRAGSNLSSKTPEEICYQDFKKFEANGISFGVGQVNFMGEQEILDIAPVIEAYMPTVAKDQGVSMVFFMMTNILKESSTMLCFGEGSVKQVAGAFNLDETTTPIYLEGVVSRKKQLIPALMTSFNN